MLPNTWPLNCDVTTIDDGNTIRKPTSLLYSVRAIYSPLSNWESKKHGCKVHFHSTDEHVQTIPHSGLTSVPC